MNRLIVIVCFYWPILNSILQFQNVITRQYDNSLARLIAYSNLALILLGVILLKNKFEILSKTARLWVVFFVLYFCFGILAIGSSGFDPAGVTVALIPVIYYCGFYFLLSNKEYFKEFFAVVTFGFVLSSFFTIIMYKLNFDFSSFAVYPWPLDRAEGLYGDANNAALASIVAFLLFDRFYKPVKPIQKLVKIVILSLVFYSLFLTFSTTGLFAFTIVFFISNFKFFTGARLVLLGVFIALFYAGVFILQSQVAGFNLSDAQVGKLENIINVLTFNFDKLNTSGRGELVSNIMVYLYENPIMGNGIDFSGSNRGHNTYLGVWVDAGIFTFLYFLFMLVHILFKSFTMKSTLRYFTMSVLVVLYIFMMSLQTVINQPYLIVLFLLVCYILDYSANNSDYLSFLDEKTE